MSKEVIGAEISMHLENEKCGLNLALVVNQKRSKEEFCQAVRELLGDFLKSEALESIWEKGQAIMAKAQIDILTSDISKG